jgi:hypothetical protein
MKSMKALAVALLLAVSPLPGHAGGLMFAAEGSGAQAVIMSAGSRAAQIRTLRSVPSVGVVNLAIRRVPRFRNDSVPDVSEYRISAEKNAAGITRLRAALKANPVTRKALAARGISINRVVGVRISSNGSLRLYLL